jgi:DNA repair protein RadC
MTFNPWQQDELIGLWEVLREVVHAAVPDFPRLLQERRSGQWRSAAPIDRAVVAIALVLGRNPDQPAILRQMIGPATELAETPAEYVSDPSLHELPTAKRELLSKQLASLRAADLAGGLSAAPGPIHAIRFLRRLVPLLDVTKAARFLAYFGYPVAIPSLPVRRWLERTGFATDGTKGEDRAEFATAVGRKEKGRNGVDAQEKALRRLEEISAAVSSPLEEVSLVLEFFCGDHPTAPQSVSLCERDPRCAACPMAMECTYGRQQRAKPEPAPSRNLASSLLREDMPREKLARLGPGALSDAELVAILYRTGSGGRHALELATESLRRGGSLDRIASMSMEEGKHLRVGDVRLITLKAALELGKRLSRPAAEDLELASPPKVFQFFRPLMADLPQEQMICVILNSKLKYMRHVVVSVGHLTGTFAQPREVYREAIKDSAGAILVLHNHPSGDPTPSRDDRLVTKRLREAGTVIGIRFLDHIIIAKSGYFSFAESRLLEAD